MTDLNKEREAFAQTEFNTFGLDVKDFKTTGEYFMFIGWLMRLELEKAKAQAVPEWISAEVGRPIKFGTRVKIKRKAWDEEDNLIFVESEATYDKDSDFCELSNRSYEYETWFDHELNKYLDEDELTHWSPLDKSESGAEG
ncbi:hypothetical protein ACG9XQ_05705 [Acinetobacter baumannii]|uniref:hypothetical protein n=1 Tax=Acinetobacter baumannii TaxID=470 RepID=UPI003AF4873A